jgi:hypothetical protein
MNPLHSKTVLFIVLNDLGYSNVGKQHIVGELNLECLLCYNGDDAKVLLTGKEFPRHLHVVRDQTILRNRLLALKRATSLETQALSMKNLHYYTRKLLSIKTKSHLSTQAKKTKPSMSLQESEMQSRLLLSIYGW